MSQLHADDWEVRPIAEHREATWFIEQFHYAQGAPNTSVARFGLYPAGLFTMLCGVALWIPPTKNAALTVDPEWESVLSLSRFVLCPDLPPNAASFLLGAAMRRLDRKRWATLLTYADTNEGHTGTIYKATNWTCLGPVPAGDTWVNAEGRQMGRKRGGRTLLAAEMRELGFTRKPSAPKIKFAHWSKASRRRYSDVRAEARS